MKQAFWIIFLCALTTGVLFAAPDASKSVPNPEMMQGALWRAGELHDFRLEGVMRINGKTEPLVMKTNNRTMVFEFPGKALQIKVQLTPSGSIVQRRAKSSQDWKTLSAQERLEPILNSDVCYEDLGVDFLRWQDVKPLGMDSIKTLTAWAYEAKPHVLSQYSKAHFWISSDYLALLRVDAFDRKGEIVKRVEINGVQKVGDAYTIKEIMISTLAPGRDVSKSKTYIEIRKAEPGSGLKG